MKKAVFLIVVLFAVIFITCGGNDNKNNPRKKVTSANTIDWLRYDTGINKAAEDGKYVLVYFWRHGCGWCKKMEQDTYANEEVMDIVNDYFIPVKVNAGSGDSYNTKDGRISTRQLVNRFRIRGFPTSCFLKPDGSVLTCQPGYVPPQKFETILRYIGEEHYKDESFQEYIKSN